MRIFDPQGPSVQSVVQIADHGWSGSSTIWSGSRGTSRVFLGDDTIAPRDSTIVPAPYYGKDCLDLKCTTCLDEEVHLYAMSGRPISYLFQAVIGSQQITCWRTNLSKPPVMICRHQSENAFRELMGTAMLRGLQTSLHHRVEYPVPMQDHNVG